MSLKSVAMNVVQKAIEHAPAAWMPGGTPDRLITHKHGLIGAPVTRIDGPLKVKGAAPFSAEFPLQEMLYAAVRSARLRRVVSLLLTLLRPKRRLG